MKDTWTAQKIVRLSGMYWVGFALHSAVELDLFTTLDTLGGTAEVDALAEALGCDRRALGMLATTLSGMGLLSRDGGTLTLSPEAGRFLSRRSDEYVGYLVRHLADAVDNWTGLTEAIRTGRRVNTSYASHTDDPEEREAFLMGMHNNAAPQARTIADALDLEGRRRLMDLGGGPGTYAITFCQTNPDLDALIFDLPTTEPFAMGLVREAGLSERIGFQGGDFFEDTLPGGCDVIWISQVLHCEPPGRVRYLVRKAAEALEPGGMLCIQEFALDNRHAGRPLHPAVFSLNMLVSTEGGQSYTDEDIRGFLQDAGLQGVRALDLSLPQGCRVFIGDKPAS